MKGENRKNTMIVIACAVPIALMVISTVFMLYFKMAAENAKG